jgi:hypothetical protein
VPTLLVSSFVLLPLAVPNFPNKQTNTIRVENKKKNRRKRNCVGVVCGLFVEVRVLSAL